MEVVKDNTEEVLRDPRLDHPAYQPMLAERDDEGPLRKKKRRRDQQKKVLGNSIMRTTQPLINLTFDGVDGPDDQKAWEELHELMTAESKVIYKPTKFPPKKQVYQPSQVVTPSVGSYNEETARIIGRSSHRKVVSTRTNLPETEEIASGSFGRIYAVEDKNQQYDTPLVVKHVNFTSKTEDPDGKEAHKQFRMEAKIATHFGAQGIGPVVYKTLFTPQRGYIYMERLQKSLHQRQQKEDTDVSEDDQAIVRMLCLMVDTGVFCVDIKPTNIMVNEDKDFKHISKIRLIDFGADYCSTTELNTALQQHFRQQMETKTHYAKIILFIIYYITSQHKSLGAIVSKKYNELLEDETDHIISFMKANDNILSVIWHYRRPSEKHYNETCKEIFKALELDDDTKNPFNDENDDGNKNTF